MPQVVENTVWTIGHSTHSYDDFLALLRRADITAIADVRTAPYSRHFSHFNQDSLRRELRLDGIAYSFLGEELGGRPNNHRYYCEGIADYEKMAAAREFKDGLERVIEGAKKYRIALMCSEHDPLDCHRCLLVGRALAQRGVSVKHILSNGITMSHSEIENRLLQITSYQNSDLFLLPSERLASAYRQRSLKVAYTEPALVGNG